MPPALEGLKELPADVDAVKAWMNFSEGLKLSCVLSTTDEDAAGRTSAALTEALGFGQQMAMQEMERSMAGDDPVQRATLTYAQRVARIYFAQIQPNVSGTDVVIEANLIDSSMVGGPVAIALLLPAVQQAREAARRTQDKNSLKQIGLALHNYHDTFNAFPARANYDESGNSLLSWRVHLLPYLEQNELYEQFHLHEPWDSEHNLTLVQMMPEVYQSKSFNDSEKTVFLTADGAGTMMEGTEGISIGRCDRRHVQHDISDGSKSRECCDLDKAGRSAIRPGESS